MAAKKNEETIKIKKTTLIISIVVIIAIIAALATVYYLKMPKQKVTTKEVLDMEPIELIATAITAKECKICMDMESVMQELKQTPFVKLRQSNILFASSDEAKSLITKYNIKKLPTIILKGERIDELPLRGFNIIDDVAVLEDVPPPYVDLDKKEISGLVDITYITDKTCTECYNVTQHRAVMELAFGLYINNEQSIDINTEKGRETVQKYKITKVPTIILSPGAGEYPTIQEVWDQLGTVEKDGNHVFRGFEMTQDLIYKDLKTGQLVNTSQMENEE